LILTSGIGEREGAVTIVTGAARGLGEAIAARLAAAGSPVFLADRDAAELAAVTAELEAAGGRVGSLALDLLDDDAPERLVAAAVETFGRVDALVNNAGIVPFAAFLDTTPEQVREVLATNAGTQFRVAQAAARRMIAQGDGGTIVNLGTIHALKGVASTAAYAMSKGAIHALTRTIAVELAPHRIRCVTLAPGTILTERVKGALDAETFASRLAKVPAGRFGTPDDVAAAALFLLGPEGGFINGQEIVVDGGFTAYGDGRLTNDDETERR
jgi:NAD(P)-dependent dehydrogenase (short-subunit alcohol dehydrogenase family)